MDKLSAVPADRLRGALAEASGAKEALRIVAALDYKAGVPVETMSERYGLPRSTLYTWLDRFEERPLMDAIADETRPGRPSELGPAQRAALRRTIEGSPGGWEAWDAESLGELIEDRCGVRYSRGHVRRLLRERDL